MTYQKALKHILNFRTDYEYFQPSNLINYSNVNLIKGIKELHKYYNYSYKAKLIKIKRVWKINSLTCSYNRKLVRLINLQFNQRVTKDFLKYYQIGN